MNKLLIHNGNIVYKEVFESSIEFPSLINIDDNISRNIISEIKSSDCEIIFVKDNLSTNYLELYGLKVAYHIRLSEELGDKRFLPIVIISDLDSYILNRVEPISRILFTKNIFLSQNNKEAIKLYDNYDLKPLHANEYKAEFLDKVQVEQPKDYLTHHSIANEWAMHRWSEYLEVITDDVKAINKKISSMLYFKYLKAKFPIKKSQFKKHQREITEAGKILYIDDEWAKGWGNILKSLHSDLHVVEEKYKDKTREEIIEFVLKRVNKVNPDLVILDMRLHEDDFKEDTHLDEFTGMQIFQKIKEINEGIQFIIFTASKNAKLLEELQSYDTNILSYIQKEHPDDNNATTQGNINTLTEKINKGLKRKYLKDIWNIQKNIISIENIDTDVSFEVKSVFEILNSDIKKSLIFAMISIFKPLEFFKNSHEYNNMVILIINNELISIDEEEFITNYERYNFRQRSHANNYARSIKNKVWSLLFHTYNYRDKKVFENIEQLTKVRNKAMHDDFDYSSLSPDLTISWFSMLEKVIFKIYKK